MDEKEFRLEVRLIALEMVAARALAFQLNHLSDSEFEAVSDAWISGIERDTIPGAPAEQGDLWSAEIAEALQAMLQMVSEVRDRLPRKR